MSHTEPLRRSPNAFRQLTGITPVVFDQLLADLTPRHEQAEVKRKNRPGRQRRPGAGRKHALNLADRLLMLLIYYRTYTTHVFLGFLFGVDDSAVSRNINPLQPLLAGIFRIPERRIKLDPEEVRELFFDATERPTRRPAEGQREFYSGKKKRHTIKNQVVTTRRTKPPGPGVKPQKLRIAAVCESSPCSVHDKKLYDRARVVGPPDARRTGDTAYIGTALETPARKPKGGRADGGAEGGESCGIATSDRGGARDRQDESVADRLGALPQCSASPHADHEECGGPAQLDVCLIDTREGRGTPFGGRGPIVQRLY